MQSHITIQSTKSQPIENNTNALILHNFKRLRMARIKEIVFNEGSVFVQSISHYLAHIELFDYSFTQQASIDFTVNQSAFFMYADLHMGSARLCYHPAGKYRKTVGPGRNQIMLITFKADWLIHKCRKITEFRSFTSFFCNPVGQPAHLQPVGMANSLIRSLIKMDAAVNDLDMDDGGYIFINSCINKYYNKLKRRNATVHYYHHKAAEISSFINTQFATEEVENIANLAARFMVSERSLARLAKIAFGRPLHEHVIKLRIHLALDLLLNTGKPIFEIAILSGYKEPYYFSKAFKKYFGICPKSVNRPSKSVTAFEFQT